MKVSPAVEIRAYILADASHIASNLMALEDLQRRLIAPQVEACFEEYADPQACRYAVFRYLFDEASSKNLTDAQIVAVRRRLGITRTASGKYLPSERGIAEMRALYYASLEDAGQMKFL